MKKILVTGALGFIGRHCLPMLVERGYEVHAISSKPSSALMQGCQIHSLDLMHLGRVERFVQELRPSHLLHLAWVTTPGIFWNAEENLLWLAASKKLLKAFQEGGGARAVIGGTCAEYDWSYETLSEAETPLNPATLYGQSKRELFEFMHDLSLSWGWGRVFQLFGPYEHPKKLVASIILALLKGETATCRHGNQVRDFLHVQDVARAFISLVESPLQAGVNIASGKPVTLGEICCKIGQLLGRAERLVVDTHAPHCSDPLVLTADVKRIYKELKWQPLLDMESGLKDAIEWWKMHAAR